MSELWPVGLLLKAILVRTVLRRFLKGRHGKELVCVDVSWSHQLSDNDITVGEPTKKELDSDGQKK